MRRLAWLAALAACGAGVSARAAEADKPRPAAKGQEYAVIVGVGHHADPRIKPRPTADADAKAIYSLVTDAQYRGVPKENVRLLLSADDAAVGAKKATKSAVEEALRWVNSKATKDDFVMIALVGQGAPLGERACMFTADSTADGRSKDALSAADIEKDLEKFKGQRLLALVDINYKGFTPAKDEKAVEPNLSDFIKVFFPDEDKEDHSLPPGRVLVLGSNSTAAVPIDGPQNGLFTEVVLEALGGKADKSDKDNYEPDGWVIVDELVNYLEAQYPPRALKLGSTRDDKEQHPVVVGGRANHFELTKNPSAYPEAQTRRDKFEKLAGSLGLDEEAVAQGRKLLERMPRVKGLQELRRTFQKLADGKLTPDEFRAERTRALDGMKLTRSAADRFAGKVTRGIAVLKSQYVKELDEGEVVVSAVKGLYKRLQEDLPDSIKPRLADPKALTRAGRLTLLADARTSLGKREDLEDPKDADLAISAMMTENGKFDPYTNYIDKEQVAKFEQEMHGRFTGIGIQIRRDLVRDGLLVITPIKDSPAYKAGVLAGDLITEIVRDVDREGKPINDSKPMTTKNLRVDEAVKKILGEPNTRVKVTVQREGVPEPKEFVISRSSVAVETVLGHKRHTDDTWDYMVDPESKIAYLRLTQFGPRSGDELEKTVKRLDKQGIKGFVLDLRFNPGGLLKAAVDICDLFIDDGKIVRIQSRNEEDNRVYRGHHDGSLLRFPMVVLVNGGSASGSEIVAACLQDHRRALVMGERSFGKGSVQNIVAFAPTAGQIKLTTASFWRPNDKNLNKSSTKGRDDEDWGVRPDAGFEEKLTAKERGELAEHLRDAEIIPRRDPAAPPVKDASKPEFKDKQLEKALDYLRGQIRLAAGPATRKAG